MNSDKLIKLIAGVGLFGAWLALVILKMTPPENFVNALQLALMALGIYHASTQKPAASVTSYVAGTAELLPYEPAPQAPIGVVRDPSPAPIAAAAPVASPQPGAPAATLQ
jgi:hypothetical protein